MAPCFGCNQKFYIKCFGVDHQLLLKLNSSDSCVRFVCGNCLVKQKRKSLSTPINESISEDSHQLNKNIEDLLRLMQTPENCYQNNRIVNDNKEDNNIAIDNIYKLLLKTTDKINEIHTKDNESKSLSTIVNLIDKKLEDFKNMMTATNHGDNDLFDNSKIANWSMQHENINFTPVTKGRNSILVKQTVDNDILEILRNSDKTNWDTLDAIRKELRSQGDTITEIKNHLATESVNPSMKLWQDH